VIIILSVICMVMSGAVAVEETSKITETTIASVEQIVKVSFTSTGFGGHDVGVGSEGDIYVVGLDGRLYQYNFLTNFYTFVEGDYELTLITRVDVDDDGTPYVIANCGQIFYLNCYNHWIQLPGCGTDIGVGRGFDVWKIGCDARVGGFGIWKLFCKSKCKCNCGRQCIRFRVLRYTAKLAGDVRKCYWYRIDGSGLRIDVHPDGNPYVINSDNTIFRYNGIDWNAITGFRARDLTLSNEGLLLAAGIDARIGRVLNESTGSWLILSGAALEISAGPYSQPTVVSTDKNVYTSTKLGFN